MKKNSTTWRWMINDAVLAALVLYFLLLCLNVFMDGYASVLFPIEDFGYILLGCLLVAFYYRYRQ